jgi:metal-dependent hydrolase (beta-lactamase superfamily II)
MDQLELIASIFSVEQKTITWIEQSQIHNAVLAHYSAWKSGDALKEAINNKWKAERKLKLLDGSTMTKCLFDANPYADFMHQNAKTF